MRCFSCRRALQVDYKTSYMIFAVALSLGTPLVVLFGALSDRVGRRPVMIAGMLLGALTFIPSFHALAGFANPGLSSFSERNPIIISANNCTFSLFAPPVSACDKARKFFSRSGLVVHVDARGLRRWHGFEHRRYEADRIRRGYV